MAYLVLHPEGEVAMRVRGFSDMQLVSLATQQVVADLGLTALPVVGFSASAGKLSCFVEVASEATETDPAVTPRTELRLRGYAEIMLSAMDLVSGREPFGFLAVERPLSLLGEEYQPTNDEPVIAILPELMPAAGAALIGPARCARCNHAIPAARVRIVGPGGLCVRCQSEIERSTLWHRKFKSARSG